MSKNLKKILTAGAALLMFTGVGASASQIVNPAHASRTSRRIASLRSRRSHDYRDIKNINTELNKLEHKYIRRHHTIHHHPIRHRSVTRQAHRVHKTYDINFTRGWCNADGSIAHGFLTEATNERFVHSKIMTDYTSYCYPQITPKYVNNKYKQGWIKSAYIRWNPHYSMKAIVNDYNKGIKYLNSHQPRNSETGAIYLNNNQQWFSDNEDNH